MYLKQCSVSVGGRDSDCCCCCWLRFSNLQLVQDQQQKSVLALQQHCVQGDGGQEGQVGQQGV